MTRYMFHILAVIHGLQSVICQSMGFVSPLIVAYFTGAEVSFTLTEILEIYFIHHLLATV
jgi:hypothetical protein